MQRPSRMFVVIVVLCVAFLAATPGRAGVFNPETFTLDNGLQVVVIPNHRVPVVTHMIYYKVGAMDEPPGKSGVAHFVEHLMFKGTKTVPPGEFSAIVARSGGQENAFTGQDYTGYFQRVAVDRLESMMKLEADRMSHLVFRDELIEPERLVVLEERSSRVENSPSGLLREQTNAALFLNHPYRIPIIGWEHEIRGLTRADLERFYGEWYAPNNAVLILSGDVTAEQVRPMVERHYGLVPARALPDRPDWREPPSVAARRVTLKHRDVKQPSWSRHFMAPNYLTAEGAGAYALQVLSEVLSGGQTGRLYRALAVEQGIAASAGGWYDPSTRGPAVFAVHASPRTGEAVDAIERGVEQEIQRVLDHGVTAEEVEAAVVRLQNAAILARDSLDTPAHVFGVGLTIGRTVEEIEAWPERIGAVTVEDVNQAARAVLATPNTVTAVLLPEETS